MQQARSKQIYIVFRNFILRWAVIWHYAKLRQNLQSTPKTMGSLDMLIRLY